MRLALAALVSLALAGCGGQSLLTTSSGAGGPSRSAYLAALASEQAKLAAAERRIPRRPRTPAALAQAVSLLRGAIARLGRDLAAIRPPAAVTALHAQLISIVRSYAARLARVERAAARRSGALPAAGALVSATRRASGAFSETIGRIDRALAPH